MARRKIGKKATPRQGLGFQPMLPSVLTAGLTACLEHIEEEDVELAFVKLEGLARAYPGRPEVGQLMMAAAVVSENDYMLLHASEILLAINPDDPDALVMAAAAREIYGLALSSLVALQRLKAIDPTHTILGEAGELPDVNWEDPELQVRLTWEAAKLSLELGRFEEAVERARAFAAQTPSSPETWELLTRALVSHGDGDEALALLQEKCVQFPQSLRLLERLAHLALLRGETELVEACRGRLREATPSKHNFGEAQALFEALARLGDHDGLILAWKRLAPSGPRSLKNDLGREGAQICHWVAVAFHRRGEIAQAQALWEKAVRLDSNLDILYENLNDQSLPSARANGPWSFSLVDWLPDGVWRPLALRLQAVDEMKSEIKQRLEHLTSVFPELVSVLLKEGDDESLRLAMIVVSLFNRDQDWAALSNFCEGSHGSEGLRTQGRLLANAVGKTALIPEGLESLHFVEMKITDEPSYPMNHGPKVSDLLEKGVIANHAQQWKKAEQIFRQALLLEPDAPDLKNNLATALFSLDKEAEALPILKGLSEDYPNYLHGRINYASVLVSRRKLEEAEALLTPLLERKQFHFDEIKLFIFVFARLKLDQNEVDTARSWIEMLEKIDPSASQLPLLKQLLALAEPAKTGRKPFIARPS